MKSKTPVKMKNMFEKGNKDSNISKGSTEAGPAFSSGISQAGIVQSERQTFKSLNEIVAVKAKEKMLMESSKLPKKGSKLINGF